MKENRFQIYYAPKKSNTISFTLNLCKINENNDSYKLKIIKEVIENSETQTYKIKEFHTDVSKILNKINKIDFNVINEEVENSNFWIQYNDSKIISNNKEEVQYILDMFEFDRLMNIPIEHYDYIKDVYEYLNLSKNFVLKEIKSKKDLALYEWFVHSNPYEVFDNEV